MSGDNGATGLNMAARRVMKCGSRPEKFRCLRACVHSCVSFVFFTRDRLNSALHFFLIEAFFGGGEEGWWCALIAI